MVRFPPLPRRARLGAVAATVILAFVLSTPSAGSAHTSYTVRSGDTLSGIAARFDVSVAQILADNQIADANRIRVGQVLAIPTAHGSAPAPAAAPTPAPAPPASVYTVRPGDSLSRIGAQVGVPWKKIAEENGLASPYRLQVGQVLRIPSSVASYPNLPQRIVADPARVALIPSFERWAAHYGVPVDLAMAVAYQETGWQTSLTSSAGAMGVGQIMPATAEWLKSSIIRDSSLDPWNPDHNIRMMMAYLGWLRAELGNEELSIAAYYQGQGSIKAGKYYEETRRYVANVNAHRRLFIRG